MSESAGKARTARRIAVAFMVIFDVLMAVVIGWVVAQVVRDDRFASAMFLGVTAAVGLIFVGVPNTRRALTHQREG